MNFQTNVVSLNFLDIRLFKMNEDIFQMYNVSTVMTYDLKMNVRRKTC